MSNMVTVKQGDFYYLIPMHEYSRYWLPHIGIDIPRAGEFVHVKRVPPEIPRVSREAGLKRGKSFKRMIKSYNQKGSGKHARNIY